MADYLDATETTEAAIMARMLATLPDDVDKTEGGFEHQALTPAAQELAQAADLPERMLARVFLDTATGDDLDLLGDQFVGVPRTAAASATGDVTFSGADGTVIPIGTRVGTASVGGEAAQFFDTTEEGTIAAGSVVLAAEAVTGGADGNVGGGTITTLISVVAGVTGITNAAPMTGGLDEEDDDDYRARLYVEIRGPKTGGSRADYLAWALAVAGVGAAKVELPGEGSPAVEAGNILITLVDTDSAPASQQIVDAVQAYIAAYYEHVITAAGMTSGGFGVTVVGTTFHAVYDAGGAGTMTDVAVEATLDEPGIWQARIAAKVNSAVGATDLFELLAYDTTAGAICKTEPGGSTEATLTLQGAEMTTSYADYVVEFYAPSGHGIELRLRRLTTDVTRELDVRDVTYRSTFSTVTDDVKAPAGHRVTVQAAEGVTINVEAVLTLDTGVEIADVQTEIEEALAAYVLSRALLADNDIRISRVGDTILDVAGVLDYSGLELNGGTANIAIGTRETASLGTVTLS